MDLFLIISVLHAKFCWLGHLGKMICPWKESVAGKETVQGVWGDLLSRVTAKLASNFWTYVRLTSISPAGSEEQIIFSQQSPKILKMASESFIHALLLFLGLFFKISRWVPLYILFAYNLIIGRCKTASQNQLERGGKELKLVVLRFCQGPDSKVWQNKSSISTRSCSWF